MKYEINKCEELTQAEVADQLVTCGAIQLECDERIGQVRLECGCDLEIDIVKVIKDDPRCDGYVIRTETYTEGDILEEFTASDWCQWAVREDGEEVLLCFGC